MAVGNTTVNGTWDFAVYRYNSNGTADTTFDTDGLVITDFGGTETVNAVSLHPNGNIFVGGANSTTSTVFAMFASNGSLDTTFKGSGKLYWNWDWRTSIVRSNGRLRLMRHYTTTYSQSLYFSQIFDNLMLVSLNADAFGDTTFGTSSTVVTPLTGGEDFANAIALQSDGKIVVASTMEALGVQDFGVSRYNSDGTLDTAFGNSGRMTLALGTSYDEARDVAIQSDGRIVVVGTSNNKFLVVRLNSDGMLDSTFDGDGIVTTAIDYTIAVAETVAVQADGKIVVGGFRTSPIFEHPNFGTTGTLLRYKTDGSLDSAFGQGGMVTTSIGTNVTDIEVLTDGRIAFVSGQLYVRLANGNADLTFGTNGKTATGGTGIAVQEDGKFVVGAHVFFGQSTKFELRRFNSDGAVDSTFDNDGLVTLDFRYSIRVGIAIQGTKILTTTGYYSLGGPGGSILHRFNSDGSADNSFGTNGRVTTSVPSFGHAQALVVQSDGRIVIAGRALRSGFPSVMRYDSFLRRYHGGSAPSDVSLNGNSIVENSAVGTIVGSLTTTDTDTPESYTYSFVPGSGSDDNSLFEISGSDLVSAVTFDFETRASYSLRIRSTDSTGLWFEKSIAISIDDINEAPTLTLTNIVTSLKDNVSTNAAIRIADIDVADDAPGTNELILTGTESGLFEITDSKLFLKAASILNGAVMPVLRLQVSVIDQAFGPDPVSGGSASLEINVTAMTPEIVAPTPPVQPLRPTFAWTDIADAVSYDVWFENLSTGNNQYRQENVVGPAYTASLDFGIGRYRVRIRSLDASQTPSRWSEPYEFSVITIAEWQPLDPVQRTSRPTLAWNLLEGAVRYDLWIDSLSPAKSPFVRITNLTQNNWTSSVALPMGQYRAWVRGIAADGTAALWSVPVVFVVSPTPVLTTAAKSAFPGLPSFEWIAILGAARYDIWIDNASTGITQFDRASVVGNTYTPSKTFGIGKYKLWIRAIDAAGSASAWSWRLDFAVNTAETIQPLNRIQITARPTLTWAALPGATRYDLWIDELSTPTSQAVRITDLTTTSGTPATDLPMGLYRAWVRGIAADGTGAKWSMAVEFYVAPAPVLTAGTNSTFDRTPTFAWTSVSGAVNYDVTILNLNTGAIAIKQT